MRAVLNEGKALHWFLSLMWNGYYVVSLKTLTKLQQQILFFDSDVHNNNVVPDVEKKYDGVESVVNH